MFGYNGGFNVWTWIILILIVLQWFRVGGHGLGGPGGESNLLCNGGLFIIALFLIATCGCFKNQPNITPYRPY